MDNDILKDKYNIFDAASLDIDKAIYNKGLIDGEQKTLATVKDKMIELKDRLCLRNIKNGCGDCLICNEIRDIEKEISAVGK